MLMRRLNRFASWIAMMAVIFASLAPTISHAFPAKNNQPSLLQELCSAQGAKRFISVDVAIDNKQAPAQNQAAMHFEHCPYCAHHAANIAIPATSNTLFLAQLNAVQNIEVYAAPLVLSYYPVSHPSHAPPAI